MRSMPTIIGRALHQHAAPSYFVLLGAERHSHSCFLYCWRPLARTQRVSRIGWSATANDGASLSAPELIRRRWYVQATAARSTSFARVQVSQRGRLSP
jgi:hypothetical protein